MLTFIKNCTYCKMSSVYTIVINRTNSGVYLYNWVQKRHRNDEDGRPKISLNVQKKLSEQARVATLNQSRSRQLAAAAACANARQLISDLAVHRTLPVIEMPNEHNDSRFYKLDLPSSNNIKILLFRTIQYWNLHKLHNLFQLGITL